MREHAQPPRGEVVSSRRVGEQADAYVLPNVLLHGANAAELHHHAGLWEQLVDDGPRTSAPDEGHEWLIDAV